MGVEDSGATRTRSRVQKTTLLERPRLASGPRAGVAWATPSGGMSLTNAQSPTYHRNMAYKPILGPSLGAFACFALLLGLAGCEDATKKPLQAPVPALAPAKVAAISYCDTHWPVT